MQVVFYSIRLSCLAIFMLLSNFICDAQIWYKANNPFGGYITEIHEATDGSLLCGTGQGLYKSTDNGENWKLITEDQKIFAVSDINTNASGTYFASFFYFIIRSFDGGQTWDTIKPQTWTAPNKILINKSGQIFLNTDNSVWRSSDNGDTWTKLSVAPNLTRLNTIDISPDDELYASDYKKKIYRSKDNGDTWTELFTASENIRVLGFDGNNVLYAGTSFSGLYKSTDNGDIWSLLPALPQGGGVYDINVNASGEVFIGAFEGGLLKSDDGGMTWTDISTDIIDPTVIKIVFKSNQELFVGTNAGGVQKQNGSVWIAKNQGINSINIERFVSIDGVLYACTSLGVFISKDGGQTWQQSIKGMGEKDIVTIAKAPNGDLFAGGDMLYHSTDGINWNNISQGFPDSEVTATDILVEPNGRLIVATDDYGIRYSDNNGQSWTNANNGLEDVTMAFIRKNSIGDFFTADGYNLYRSSDLSGKWEIINDGITDTDITEFTSGNGVLFAVTYSDGVFKSVDNGNKWTLSTDQDVENVTVNGNEVYASSTRVINGGVLFSVDNGDNWKNISKGLPYESAEQVAYVSGQGLFAHVRDYGLYTLDFSVNKLNEISLEKIKIKCFPNPFIHNTTLELELIENFNGSYSIYTLQGQMVHRSENLKLTKGNHSFDIGDELPQGSYIVNINNGHSAGNFRLVKVK